ncbi:DUF2892 domain-containing protein [Humisphaera borealis]|uniref:DUF2892 domain-containing protein n=2 Tax=Humisphaera borealis TaxID=2807512 RepID=A0A7M2X666_9BACT|nr:DUF2892 domain-containing protein [Humisphaera borealis]
MSTPGSLPGAQSRETGKTKNVGDPERLASMVAGAVLAVGGMKMRGLAGLAMLAGAGGLIRRGYTGHCPLNTVIHRNSAEEATPESYYKRGIHVQSAFTIQKPRNELFAFWRDFQNLPRFMKHLKKVAPLGGDRWHWEIHAPAGSTVSWDAEIVNEVQDELIAWKSAGGADVDNAGSVRFLDAPGDRGTEVRVVLDYIPPGDVVGKWVATLFGKDPAHLIKSDLRRFKQLMEAGEIPTIEGQSKGECTC